MRPQLYTENYRQLSKAGNTRGGLSPGKSIAIDCPVSNENICTSNVMLYGLDSIFVNMSVYTNTNVYSNN